MRYFIGLDDTDNQESRGTGFRSRELGRTLHRELYVKLIGITRHQLFIHADIPYTSQNSSACLEVETDDLKSLIEFCKSFMIRNAAIGSDVGLCIAEVENVTEKVSDFGKNAKKEVLQKSDAQELAGENKIFLEGLTGTKGGIIGALAAVGLRKTGNDGRFIWLKGLREFEEGIYTPARLKQTIDIDEILTIGYRNIHENETIFCEEWIRPVLKNHKKLIFASEVIENEKYKWQIASKEFFKSLSD